MDVKIIDYSIDDSKKCVMYVVNCTHETGVKWTAKKRYSEFLKLHNHLLKFFPQKNLPKFPPKILFGNTSKANIQKRSKKLQDYINILMNDESISEYEPFLAFFDEEGKYLQNVRTMSGGPSSTPVTGKTSSPDNSNPASKNSTNAGPTGQNLQPKPGNQSVEDGFSLQEKPLFEVVALYDYEKQDESEISFKKNQKIAVVQKDSSGWWCGYVKDDNFDKKNPVCGFFPNNHVKIVSTTLTSQNNINNNNNTNQPPTQEANNAAAADGSENSDADANDVENADANSEDGLDPSGEGTGESEKKEPNLVGEKKFREVHVLYSYEADGRNEISVKVNDKVELLEVGKNGWCFVRKRVTLSDEVVQGWVPQDYLDEID